MDGLYVSPESSPIPTNLHKMNNFSEKQKDHWVGTAFNMLRDGKSQISISIFLKAQGVPEENLKELSYEIFEQAKKRLNVEQRFPRAFAWSLIIVGCLMPIFLIYTTGWILFAAFVPIIFGHQILSKLPNPKAHK